MEDEPVFNKQRRNLIAISLLMIFYSAADLEIEKISILGNQTTLNNPNFVLISIIVFYFYFLIRFHSVSLSRNTLQDFKTQYLGYFNAREYRIAIKKVDRLKKKQNKNLSYPEGIGRKTHFKFIKTPIYISNNVENNEQIRIELKLVEVMILHFKSFIKFIFVDVYFLEYIFPYLIAVLAFFEVIYFHPISYILSHMDPILRFLNK